MKVLVDIDESEYEGYKCACEEGIGNHAMLKIINGIAHYDEKLLDKLEEAANKENDVLKEIRPSSIVHTYHQGKLDAFIQTRAIIFDLEDEK